MQILLFAVLLLCAYLGTLFGFDFWIKRQPEKVLKHRLSAGSGAFLMGAITLGLACTSILFGAPTLMQYTRIVVTLFGLLYVVARFGQVKATIVWMPLACAAGTYILHKAMPQIEMDWVKAGVVFVSWLVTMGVVRFFDRVPLLNFLTLGAWALAFAVMTATGNFIPPQIAIVGMLVLVAVWAITSNLSRRMEASLGAYASTLLSFIMGGMIAACIGLGSYGTALSLMSYYIFECVFFGLAWMGFHPFGMQKGMFAFESALTRIEPSAVVKLVFYRLITLSLLAVLMWQTNKIGILLIIIFVILLDTYNRFKTSKGAPSIRDMWHDTKDGLKRMWQQYKNKEDQKAILPPKQVSSKKKTVKKTTQKKPIKRKKKK